MKLLKRLSVLTSALLLFCSFTLNVEKAYVGKWKGQDKGDIGFLTLTADGYATFEFDGQTMGGKSYNFKGINAAMKYTVDETSIPYKIDFIIHNLDENVELGKMPGIIKMNGTDKMEMAMAFGGSSVRPTDFSVDNITFNRHKE